MIEAQKLVKRYGSTVARNDLSFSILPGMGTGFLGPNGAGTTTTKGRGRAVQARGRQRLAPMVLRIRAAQES